MQIIIPMSGFGERFRKAGYAVPKPLIEVEGKPIIAHVIDMFPGETDFIFICNEDHLAESKFRMREILQQYCPTGCVVSIAAHKLGPVHAVLQAEKLIRHDSPVIVNYCDFTCFWDWPHFKQWAAASKCDGALPAYRGFHPHTLGTTNYAYMRERQGWMLDIQEKQPYTDNRMQEYASSGTYYFSSGAKMLAAFKATMTQDLRTGGEYYVSLTYKPMLAAGDRIAVYPLQHFMQWGTPEDVDEYNYWSHAFHTLLHKRAQLPTHGANVIPMAGLGERFRREGYTLTKPLIPVSGAPMVVQATRDLPPANDYVFIVRDDMPGVEDVAQQLLTTFPHTKIVRVAHVTEGQACTAQLGVNALDNSAAENPITFGTCDHGLLFDAEKWQKLVNNPDVDVIVWAIRGYTNAARHPQMYGWINAADDAITTISVKVPLDNPRRDPIVLGTFTFKRGEDFLRCVERMMARNGRVNGEFYIDTCINDALELGLRCHLFEVDSYLSWGTPNDLRTFEYWQSCFHKWPSHPYRLENDSRITTSAVADLERHYKATLPELPA